MQYAQRKKFDFLLTNRCINKVNWTPQTNQQQHLQAFATCIHLTTRAETIFRAHLVNPRPGEVKWYPSGLQD